MSISIELKQVSKKFGEVTAVNETLATAPEKLNEDPHGAAWLVKVRMKDPGEIKQLLNASDYQTYIGAES